MKLWNMMVGGRTGSTAFFPNPFRTHDLARAAAERAAGEQRVSGETRGISWEDAEGRWHDELSEGDDRPTTDVKG
jgi:hypothetical protein